MNEREKGIEQQDRLFDLTTIGPDLGAMTLKFAVKQEDQGQPEIFDTIQGEGRNLGKPVVFARLSGCNLQCSWCDSILKGTLVRTADKKWLPIEDIPIGTEIISVGKERQHILQKRYGYKKALATHRVSHIETKAIEISFSNGQKLTTTYNHPLFIRRTSTKGNPNWDWLAAEKLSVGDTAWSIGSPQVVEETEQYILGWLQGYTDGDGHFTEEKTRWETITPEIFKRTQEYLNYAGYKFNSRVASRKTSANRDVYQVDCKYKPFFNKENTEWRRGYVAGFYDAEGSNNDVQPEFNNKDKSQLDNIRKYLNDFGYLTSFREGKNCLRLIVSSTLSKRLEFDSFFNYVKPHNKKWFWGEDGLRGGKTRRKIRTSKQLVTIEDIKYLRGKFEFYDIGSTEGNFIANGIVVHNTPYTWVWNDRLAERHDQGVSYDMSQEQIKLTVGEAVDVISGYPLKRLVITGGEPLAQQKGLTSLITGLKAIDPDQWVEIETNGTIAPTDEMLQITDQFNVSVKLANSNNEIARRRKDKALKVFASTPKADFKFVVFDDKDLPEILDIVKQYNIPHDRVFLMPEGRTEEEVTRHQQELVELAKKQNFNITTRLHVLIYGSKRGV